MVPMNPTIPMEIDYESMEWEQTPYEGVFISNFDNEPDPSNPKIPKITANAVRIDPYCEMGFHSHQRKDDWDELIIFSGGNFEFFGTEYSEVFSESNPVYKRIKSGEGYGIRNLGSKPLYFISILKPGFTGYGEIREGPDI